MPQIRLKPNSPEFDDPALRARPMGHTRTCDMPGCAAHGDFRAPKDRSLANHYWFCRLHVEEYNAAWNFFAGMADADVERQIINDLYGDRPTYRSDTYRGLEADLKRKIYREYHFTDEDPPEEAPFANPAAKAATPELEALTILGLVAPVTFEAIKIRYRALVKAHHPDHHGHTPQNVEIMGRINMAYTILKMAYRPTS